MRPLYVPVLALLFAGACVCAQADVTARVDTDTIVLGDLVQLTVTVSGGGLTGGGEPQLPPLGDFRVLSTSTGQNVTIVNGSVQSSSEYVYQLQPIRAGKLRIGAIHYKGGATEPISITVLKGGGGSLVPPPGGGMAQPGNPFAQAPPVKPVLVKQSATPRRAYVGQQVTYTFSFYLAQQLYGQPSYEQSETPGFVAEDLPAPPASTETVNNTVYQVQRRRRALFATAPGKHTIGEAIVNVETDPFSGQQRLVAAPVSVTVVPLPTDGQPANFSGAVGRFRAQVSVDRMAVRARESVTCTVRLTGTGNLRSLGVPALHLPADVRVFKSNEKRSVMPGGGGGDPAVVGGTAEFSFLLLPQREGTLTIPSLDYPYFDPTSGTYRVAHSQPLTVTVTPGVAGGAAAGPTLSLNGLRPNHQALGRPLSSPVTGQAWFWIVLGLPLALVLWSGWQRWQEVRLLADPAQARSGGALGLARRRLDGAERLLATGNQDACYTEINATVSDYVADRTGAPPSGLTADAAQELLLRSGATPELAGQARALLERSAAGRFAPGAAGSGGAGQLLAEARELLPALQRQVTPPRA